MLKKQCSIINVVVNIIMTCAFYCRPKIVIYIGHDFLVKPNFYFDGLLSPVSESICQWFFSNKIMKMLIRCSLRAALEIFMYSCPHIVCEMLKTPRACCILEYVSRRNSTAHSHRHTKKKIIYLHSCLLCFHFRASYCNCMCLLYCILLLFFFVF